MNGADKNVESKPTKMVYESPAMKKHQPVKIMQGSPWDDCYWSLYYTSLYYPY